MGEWLKPTVCKTVKRTFLVSSNLTATSHNIFEYERQNHGIHQQFQIIARA